MRIQAPPRDEPDAGQASVELLALIPALVVIGTLCWQALLVGETWWLAHAAAREAARAAALGQDAGRAASALLPQPLHHGLRVGATASGVRLTLSIPTPLPGVHLGTLSTSAA